MERTLINLFRTSVDNFKDNPMMLEKTDSEYIPTFYRASFEIVAQTAAGLIQAGLKKGDRVLTGGGTHGRITGLTDSTVTMEIAEGVRVKVNRGSIMTTASAAEKQAAPAKKRG